MAIRWMDIDLSLSLFIVWSLILLNGFFSGAEIAIISLRKSRTHELIKKGNKRAALIQGLQNNPDNFFATVQIGVTFVSVFNGVFAGSQLASKLEPYMEQLSFASAFSYEISLFVIVVGITYLSLIFGELVPKSLALQHSERFALAIVYPFLLFSRVFQLFTKILTFSSNLVLKPFKDKTSFSGTRLSQEEILHMVEEGVRAGTIDKSEHELIENVLEINDTAAREVMVPRVEIIAVSSTAGAAELSDAADTYFSRLPVFDQNLDKINGILHIKDLMRAMMKQKEISLQELIRPPYFVPEEMKIGKILQEMQKRKIHMAIVVDEYGGTAGLLTMEDILEEIVGEIDEVQDDPDQTKIIPQSDGSYLVSGICSIIDFNEYFESHAETMGDNMPDLPESDAYNSLAGFIIKSIGRFPEVGETIISGHLVFKLIRRVGQKLVLFRMTHKKSNGEVKAAVADE